MYENAEFFSVSPPNVNHGHKNIFVQKNSVRPPNIYRPLNLFAHAHTLYVTSCLSEERHSLSRSPSHFCLFYNRARHPATTPSATSTYPLPSMSAATLSASVFRSYMINYIHMSFPGPPPLSFNHPRSTLPGPLSFLPPPAEGRNPQLLSS